MLRKTLEAAVVKRLMSDAPYAALLSGGLDSSIIAAIASKHLKKLGQKLTTFSVGIAGSPDLQSAREVAKFLGTNHHEVIYTPDEGLDAISDVIYHVETVTLIRAATPCFLLARRIKSLGFKVQIFIKKHKRPPKVLPLNSLVLGCTIRRRG